MQVQLVGYSALNVFMQRGAAGTSAAQPTGAPRRQWLMCVCCCFLCAASRLRGACVCADPNARDVVLNEGAFQLPLSMGVPSKEAPMTGAALDALPRCPCATVLVRIVRAPRSRDGCVRAWVYVQRQCSCNMHVIGLKQMQVQLID